MRRPLSFAVHGAMLNASLDLPDDGVVAGRGGLLIVSGGNEPRCGAHRGMAMLADRLAFEGHGVLRFDRRGVGDSDGDNGGFRASRDDIATAIAAFRAAVPDLGPLTGYGNCDGASALLLHQPLALERLVLANPWTLDDEAPADASDTPALPPAAMIRARYAIRLRDPLALARQLLRGELALSKALRGVSAMLRPGAATTPGPLAAALLDVLATSAVPTTILLAARDRTGATFRSHWNSKPGTAARANPALHLAEIDSASHSFAGADGDWLAQQLLAALRGAYPAA